MTAKLSSELSQMKWERKIWKKGFRYIAGVDEAGRGPLAGPVVAAAVIFPKRKMPFEVNDSKKLSVTKREFLYHLIFEHALAVGIGMSDEKVIDKINILQATYRAMMEAIRNLQITPDHILVDGIREIPDLSFPQIAIVKGDQKCFSIAAASIIAKVTRDQLMIKYDKRYPCYQFAKHKGYPTRHHIEAIQKYGFCPIHRTTFKIKRLVQNGKKCQ